MSFRLAERDGLTVIEYDILRGVRHGIVVKTGGADIDENKVYAALGRNKKLVVTEQTHSDRVAAVDTAFDSFYPQRVGVDGLMTGQQGTVITIHTADCVPVLVSSGKTALLVHAGWRGSAAGIAGKAVRELVRRYGEDGAKLRAVIGPAICQACYQVGAEVAGRFPGQVKQSRDGGWQLDLKQENRRQLLAAGVPDAAIEVSGHCTRCDAALFHSYRREGRLKGTMIAFMEVGDV